MGHPALFACLEEDALAASLPTLRKEREGWATQPRYFLLDGCDKINCTVRFDEPESSNAADRQEWKERRFRASCPKQFRQAAAPCSRRAGVACHRKARQAPG